MSAGIQMDIMMMKGVASSWGSLVLSTGIHYFPPCITSVNVNQSIHFSGSKLSLRADGRFAINNEKSQKRKQKKKSFRQLIIQITEDPDRFLSAP